MSCAPVDRRTPFFSPSYVEAFDRTVDKGAAAKSGQGDFTAGWARKAIDAPAGVPLAGYGARMGAESTGTKDPAYVRAFAIGAGDARAVVFTADLLLTTPQIANEVRAQLDDELDAERIFFTASHTHSGPGAYKAGLIWELVLGDYDDDAFSAIVAAHVESAREALSKMAPAKIGTATTRVPGLIKNRTEAKGPVDDELFVMTFERAGDGRSAAFWSYGCHAVVLPPENLEVSADYPGAVAQAFEGQSLEVLGFAAGGVGSSNPAEDPTTLDRMATPLTKGLNRAIAEAKQNAKTSGTLAAAQVAVPTPRYLYRVTEEIMLWPWVSEILVGTETFDVGSLSIDDVVFLHLPVEISGELTKAAKRSARRKAVTLVPLTFNGSYGGYVVPHRVYDLPEDKGEELFVYETRTMTFFGKYGADYALNLGLRLATLVHESTTTNY